MRKVALVAAILSFGLLSMLGFRAGSLALGSAAAAVGTLWLTLLFANTDRKHLSLLLGLSTAITVLDVLYGASVYIAGLAIVLSIMAWEFALTEQVLAPFPAETTRKFVVRHVVKMLALSLIEITLLVLPLQVHIGLGFATALGLGLGSFLLFAVLLAPMRARPEETKKRSFVNENGIAVLRDAMKKKTDDRSDRPS